MAEERHGKGDLRPETTLQQSRAYAFEVPKWNLKDETGRGPVSALSFYGARCSYVVGSFDQSQGELKVFCKRNSGLRR
jgi:hypothetical protein